MRFLGPYLPNHVGRPLPINVGWAGNIHSLMSMKDCAQSTEQTWKSSGDKDVMEERGVQAVVGRISTLNRGLDNIGPG